MLFKNKKTVQMVGWGEEGTMNYLATGRR